MTIQAAFEFADGAFSLNQYCCIFVCFLHVSRMSLSFCLRNVWQDWQRNAPLKKCFGHGSIGRKKMGTHILDKWSACRASFALLEFVTDKISDLVGLFSDQPALSSAPIDEGGPPVGRCPPCSSAPEPLQKRSPNRPRTAAEPPQSRPRNFLILFV